MTSTTTAHQTVRLSPGSHGAPDEGMCVMELASVLAGETFTDRPASVCPIVAAFLRGYNDHLPDHLRHHVLVGWASDVVGTWSPHPGVTAQRLRLIEQFAGERLPWTMRPTMRYRDDRALRSEFIGARCGPWVAGHEGRRAVADVLLSRLCEHDHGWAPIHLTGLPSAVADPAR